MQEQKRRPLWSQKFGSGKRNIRDVAPATEHEVVPALPTAAIVDRDARGNGTRLRMVTVIGHNAAP
jgi:hypothetical protein